MDSPGAGSDLVWTGHNIALPDGTLTIPDNRQPFVASARYQAIVGALETMLRGPVAGARIVDMGCFEGGFSFGLAQSGASVLGVEAREANLAKLRWVEERLSLPNVSFVQADVKHFVRDETNRFDAVLALGILYHLDDPVGWLREVRDLAPVVLIDTSCAPASDDELARSKFAPRLGPLTTITHGKHTYEGRWFHEFAEGRDPDPLTLASWSNAESFWLTKEALVRALLNLGYPSVVEYHTQFTLDARSRQERTRVIAGARRDG